MLRRRTTSINTPPMTENTISAEKHAQIRKDLTKELEAVIKAAIASPHSSSLNVPREITQNLCNTIEAIFIHGLKDPFFLKGTRYSKYPEPNFWPLVSKYSHPSITDQIGKLKQIKSEIGKSRAWIRIVINEKSLEEYLQMLGNKKSAMQQFYSDHAFLRYLADSEVSEQIRGLLKPLVKLPIDAATNSSFLNSWTPTPLILAGLMSGNPLRVGDLKARINRRPGSESEEIALPAFDVLVDEVHTDSGSPPFNHSMGKILVTRPPRPMASRQNHSDDDNSSTYSHASKLDIGEMNHSHATTDIIAPKRSFVTVAIPKSKSSTYIPISQSPLWTSTPVERTILEAAANSTTSSERKVENVLLQSSANDEISSFQPVEVTRRQKRPKHPSSRSSSEASTSQNSANAIKSRRDSPRQSRANSDLPSTIIGTVPDVSTLRDELMIRGRVSETMDSGIESDKRDTYRDSLASQSLFDVMSNMAATSTSGTGMDEFLASEAVTTSEDVKKSDDDELEKEEDPVFDEDEEVFAASMSTKGEQAVEGEDVENESEQKLEDVETLNLGKEMTTMPLNIAKNQPSDSVLGTSLRDELADAMPQQMLNSFDPQPPMFVMPPMAMGNSLAAHGARQQMAWESMSERSRLSSSSDSGPVMSFGQALRSAMDGVGAHNESDDSPDAGNVSGGEDFVDESPISRKTSRASKASSVVVETTTRLCRIAREVGLDAQDFRCAMCRKSIGGPTYAKYDMCAIDGMYYCMECMKPGGVSSIPARVVMDWDWRERSISDRGRAWIEANQEKALINIQDHNPQLYRHVPALEETRILREKLQIVSMYLFTCRESVAEDFSRRIWPKEYMHKDIHKYSFSDLCDVRNGTLQKRLSMLLKHAVNHVMTCNLCRQKGFLCELCSINEVIYPFQTETTHRCSTCFSVYHKACFSSAADCPKCTRRAQFDARRALIDDPHSVLILQP